MRFRAPAKVNLCLRVLARRDDGYHLIDTVMVPVNLFDDVEITARRPGRARHSRLAVTCDDPAVPSGDGNIVYRAARLLLRAKNVVVPIRIHIRKRIPLGAGLGGGSSDAAATLRGLNRLLRLGCGPRELLRLAARLGADVPFFIGGRPARVRGIGERLTPIATCPRLWMVILYPRFSVSTRWAYQSLKLTKAIETTRFNFSLKDPRKIGRVLVNDLERATLRRYPQIAQLKRRLVEEGAHGVLMSGSGSSVFGVFSRRSDAKNAYARVRRERSFESFLVRSLSVSNARRRAG